MIAVRVSRPLFRLKSEIFLMPEISRDIFCRLCYDKIAPQLREKGENSNGTER